jgi:hypoxanthine-DNA glycosylase
MMVNHGSTHFTKSPSAARIEHPLAPIFDARSKILILGTFPSPKSREALFYYAHPQNCFWATLAFVLEKTPPAPDPAAKTAFLLRNRVAMWDVIHSCAIDGASDSSIRDPVFNEFRPLIEAGDITTIFTTGQKATQLFNTYCSEEAGMDAVYLPSTSPANRAYQSRPAFMERWMLVHEALAAL